LSAGMEVGLVEIRRLDFDEANVHATALISLLYEILAANFPNASVMYAEKYYHDMVNYIKDGSAIVYSAFDHDKLIGLLWGYEVTRLGQKRMHGVMIGVQQEYRGQDIGTSLLLELEAVALAHDVSIVEVMVSATNERAVQYYGKNGFSVEQFKMYKRLS